MERVSSIFSQILKFFPRSLFASAVSHHQGDMHSKGMTCWSQFVALLFCHLGGAGSLREIIGGLAASEGKLRHLGIDPAPSRSTLAYANEHRPWQIYQAVFQQLLSVCQADARARKRKFRLHKASAAIGSCLADTSPIVPTAPIRKAVGMTTVELNCLSFIPKSPYLFCRRHGHITEVI